MRVVRVIAITIVWLAAVLPLEAATLTWDASSGPNVAGYRVSYGTQPGVHSTQVDVGNVLTFNLAAPPPGQTYYVVVEAYSENGNSPKSNEVVLSSTTNQPPTLNQPPNQSGLVGSSASLLLTASDPENATLTFSATGLPPGLTLISATRTISGTLQTAGTYNVTATVSDGTLTTSRSFTWIVTAPTTTPPPAPPPPPPPPPADTTAPAVAFTEPSNNQTLNGKNVKVRVSVSDAGGIRSVRYFLNGNALSGELTGAPYNYTWDIGSLAAGAYQLQARAVDNAGNVGTTTITVTIQANGNPGNGKKSLTDEELEVTDKSPSSDIPVSGDFDGDGIDDPGAFTPSTGEWRLFLSSVRYAPSEPLVWGGQNDVPVPADYDGDGRTDLAVYRPSSGTWSIVMSNKGNPSRFDVAWGRDEDAPMAFDYDQDGKADLALRRPGGFDILLSSKGYGASVAVR
jgi:hypothetical protein